MGKAKTQRGREAKLLKEWEDYFYKHAGHSYTPGKETEEQGRRRGARELAKAYLAAQADEYVFTWTHEEDPDTSWMNAEQLSDLENGRSELLTVGLWRKRPVQKWGGYDDAALLASVSGVHTVRGESDASTKVVEAELALEAGLGGGRGRSRMSALPTGGEPQARTIRELLEYTKGRGLDPGVQAAPTALSVDMEAYKARLYRWAKGEAKAAGFATNPMASGGFAFGYTGRGTKKLHGKLEAVLQAYTKVSVPYTMPTVEGGLRVEVPSVKEWPLGR